MKILFIRSPKMDYVQDLTYFGLAALIGARNVRIVNWNLQNLVKTQRYPKSLREYAPSFGTIPLNWNRNELGTYDAIIVASCKVNTLEYYLKMVDKIPKTIPVIFLDGGDEPAIFGDLVRYGREDLIQAVQNKRPFDIIFKREYLVSDVHEANVFPIPMCVHKPTIHVKSAPKKYDVTFWAGDNNPTRSDVLHMIQDKWDCRKNGTFVGNKRKTFSRKGQFYLEELSACNVAYNFRGTGWDTLRYWEIPAVGSFMLSGRPQIKIPNNFEHEKHAIFCQNDLSDLEELTNYYLKHEDKREAIAKAGTKHLMQYHTSEVRARDILEKVSALK